MTAIVLPRPRHSDWLARLRSIQIGLAARGAVGLGLARSAAPALVVTNFFTSSYTGTRNNFSGYVGFAFQMAQNATIRALGRSVSTTITQSHLVRVYDGASPYNVLAEVNIDGSSPVDALGYAYEALSSPLAVTSGTLYIIASREYNGGDWWRDWVVGPLSSHTPVAMIRGVRYGSGDAIPSTSFGSTDQGFVPPTFFY